MSKTTLCKFFRTTAQACRTYSTSSTYGGLSQKDYRPFKIQSVLPVNHNTNLYRINLASPSDSLVLPVGAHISIKATIDGKMVTRSYTPVSINGQKGHFDLLVKIYPQGKISKYLAGLRAGDEIWIRGPKGRFSYHPNQYDHLLQIAGGTGITPMLQVIRAIEADPSDKTGVTLIFANNEERDILLKEEFDRFPEKFKQAGKRPFTVHYVLENPPPLWKGATGYVSKELIQQNLKHTEKEKVLVCGPRPMVQAMEKHLQDIGVPPEKVFKF